MVLAPGRVHVWEEFLGEAELYEECYRVGGQTYLTLGSG